METSYDVAVFPLPNLVFFPATILPLHIFEPRYRQMTEDALAGDGRILIAQLQPGWERDYEGRPPTYEIGCVGRVLEHQALEDGRFNLLLVGVERVRIESWLDPTDKLYRIARVEPAPEAEPRDPAAASELSLKLHRALRAWNQEQEEKSFHGQFLAPTLAYAALVNLGALLLPLDGSERQKLLELDDLSERGRQVLGAAEEVLARTLFLKPFRAFQPANPRVN